MLAVLLIGVATISNALEENSTYREQREFLLAQEQVTILGQSQVLTSEEQSVNEILMNFKMEELNAAFSNLNYIPAKSFFLAKEEMEASDVFKILRQMPKGAALHLHDVAMASVSWVISEISYWENLYMCYTQEGQLLTKFMETPDASCEWQLMSDVRASYPTPEDFDEMLLSKLTLLTDKPAEKYPDINVVWSAFEGTLIALSGMLMYRPAWEAYLYRALSEFVDDNVLYVEFRGTLSPIYELNGTELTEVESIAVYKATSERFRADRSNEYFGTRFIYAPLRRVDNSTVWNYVNIAKELKQHFPDYIAGFDLVGQEDRGLPLIDIIDPLLSLSTGDVQVPVFYHAGETSWMGMSTDDNLIDALLLNSTRIGHGYAITKHPEAKEMALQKEIPLEVCPISNQVLMLISDLRNHPVAGLVSEGFPIIISADDPGAWGSQGLSYDFYEAFMAFGGAKADLRFLKQVAINSIKYTSLDEDATAELMLMWLAKWDEFIATIRRLHNKNSKLIAVQTSNSTLENIKQNLI